MNLSKDKILYPLKFKPILKKKLWGGNNIIDVYKHTETTLDNIGESWIISSIEGNESEVYNGELAGEKLSNLIKLYKDLLTGADVYRKNGNNFHLLLKLIDAQEDLSIQVHPNDELAQKRYGLSGKSEMWYILNAESHAYVTLGFTRFVSREEYIECIKNNTLDKVLKKYYVQQGDAFFVPAGMVHSIGRGCLILEVQQSSDITYRIYDYSRKDGDGNLRELHTDLALDAIDFNNWEGKKLDKNQNGNLISNSFFNVDELIINNGDKKWFNCKESFEVLFCVEGAGWLSWSLDCKRIFFKKGETIFIPSSIKEFYLEPISTTQFIRVF